MKFFWVRKHKVLSVMMAIAAAAAVFSSCPQAIPAMASWKSRIFPNDHQEDHTTDSEDNQ